MNWRSVQPINILKEGVHLLRKGSHINQGKEVITTKMATTPVVTTPPTLEQKIDQAAAEAAQITSMFSPVVATAMNAGVAMEPVISGFIQMIIGLFKHHTSQTVPSAPVATAPVSVVAPPTAS